MLNAGTKWYFARRNSLRSCAQFPEILVKKFLYFTVRGFSNVHRGFLAASSKIARFMRASELVK
jgi:hypothetical protein